MKRWVVVILVLGAFGLGAAVGTAGLLWATGGLAEPSRDAIEVVPTLSLDAAPTAAPDILVTQIAELGAKIDAVATQVAELAESGIAAQATPDLPPAEADETGPAAAPEAEAAAPTGPSRALFRITEEQSEGRFYIEEILLGAPTTVIGTTRRVAGDVIVNFANPSQSQVGEIAINVRTLRTDQDFRDQAIRGQILQTTQPGNEFTIFAPTRLIGLPDTPVSIGDTVEFQIEGDLTIKGVTRSVIFDTSVTLAAPDRIEGIARTEIAYADYGITINLPPQVGGVADDLILEIDFVALLVEAV
jgi:polyisoprenoid-binding protein YceI